MITLKKKSLISLITLIIFVGSNVVAPFAVLAADLSTSDSDQATTNKSAYSTSNQAYAFNVTNFVNVLPAIIGCTGIANKIKRSMTDLFSGDDTADILKDSTTSTLIHESKHAIDGGFDEDGFNSEGSFDESVPTSDLTTQSNTSNTSAQTKQIKEEEKQKKLREECLNGVAYALAKAQLASITNKTVNWINSGFNGDPLFIRDRESYFKSLGEQTLQTLLGPLASFNNQTIYPFGQDFARSAILSAKTTFLDRSRSTLSNSLKPGATTDDFADDFSQGGWDGWFSLTQNPQNNPLGFGILASQELSDRTSQKEEEKKAELVEGEGFLSQKKCVEYAKKSPDDISSSSSSGTYTISSKDTDASLLATEVRTTSASVGIRYTAKEVGTVVADISQGGTVKATQSMPKTKVGVNDLGVLFENLSPSTSYTIEIAYQSDKAGSVGKRLMVVNIATPDKAKGNQDTILPTNTSTNINTTDCVRWETVTPGNIIADQLKVNLGSSVRQLELADSLNESLSAIFEALMNQLINQGLSSLSNTRNIKTNGLGGEGLNRVYDTGGNLLATGGLNTGGLSVNKGSGWYNISDQFDITKDLGDTYKIENGKRVLVKKGVISIQNDYIIAAKNSMQELPAIIPSLAELDYCIPGPNPRWKEIAVPRVNSIIEGLRTIESGGAIREGGSTWFEKNFHKFSGLGYSGITIGTVVGLVQAISSLTSGNVQEQLDKAVTEAIETFYHSLSFKIKLETLKYQTYRDKIEELYGPSSPMRDPTSAWYVPMAETGLALTKNLIAYDQSMPQVVKDYKDQISQAQSSIYKLEQIKKKVDAIVAAARKRRADDIRTGKIKLSPECANLAPKDMNADPNKIGSIGNPNTGTGNNTGGTIDPSKLNAKMVSPKPNFTISTKEDLNTCRITITTQNTSQYTVGPYTWDIAVPNVPSMSASGKTFSDSFSTFSNSGTATIKLTVQDYFGGDISISKTITITKRTKTLSGATCPS